MMSTKINIAIDGYSSCGKGTLAKALAHHFNYLFVDSGAMYRAVTWAIQKEKIELTQIDKVSDLLNRINIRFIYSEQDKFYQTYINDQNIEKEIRSMEVSRYVSEVSAIKEVRDFLVNQQQQIGLKKGVVMDGRDIGTVVFPDAELKIFMTARPEVRAQRRHHEIVSRGDTHTSYNDVLSNLTERDSMDSSRSISPLKPASDALVLDNSEMTREQQLTIAIDWVNERIKNLS
jgi:cytidylate kinase